MASSTRDAAEKATWSQMAKRWLAYAEYYEDRRSAFSTRAETRHRRTHSRWDQISISDYWSLEAGDRKEIRCQRL